MADKKPYVIVHCDDWQELYINGKRAGLGGHTIPLFKLQKKIPDAKLCEIDEFWADDNWVEETVVYGDWPDDLKDVNRG